MPHWLAWALIAVVVAVWIFGQSPGGGGGSGSGGSGGSGGGGGGGSNPTATAAPGSGGGTAADCPSTWPTKLFHLEFATALAPGSQPAVADDFPVGTSRILALLGWDCAKRAADLEVSVFDGNGDPLLTPQHHLVVAGAGNGALSKDPAVGFAFALDWTGSTGWPAGKYLAQVSVDGVLASYASFGVGQGSSMTVNYSGPTDSGPIPYKDPAQVLVVTNEAVLREHLGNGPAEQVFAAARKVGALLDLDAIKVPRDDPFAAAKAILPYLKDGTYHYLLILGNADAVPFFYLINPVGGEEVLNGQVNVPSDDPYGDTVPDVDSVPDIATARIPSSDDAALLLTQLGQASPPDGGGYLLLNQQRQAQGQSVVDAMRAGRKVTVAVAPPTELDAFNTGDAGTSRYLYILLHGGPADTTTWWTNIQKWTPVGGLEATDPLAGEWDIDGYDQHESVTLTGNPGSHGLVEVGSCFGAWTLPIDGIPKTRQNSLALYYLSTGARAFIADTHISYSDVQLPDGIPRGRTGFEVEFWKAINLGNAPIDAFLIAKRRMAEGATQLRDKGELFDAAVNEKTIHYMIFLGRP